MPTVLYAEDDPKHRMMMREFVRDTDIILVEVADGQAALQKIEAQPPDLILLDLVMPELDGFGVIKAVKANPQTRQIPIIVVSAWPTGDNQARIQKFGASDFIEKPYNPVKLIKLINKHLPINNTIQVTDYLQVELIPSGKANKPLLTIRATDAEDQTVTIYLDETGQLIDALSRAAARLVALEAETRQRLKVETTTKDLRSTTRAK